MATIGELIKRCDNDPVLLGGIQELDQLRQSQIQSAVKFLGNSEFKQLRHITSELIEVWCAWVKWKIFQTFQNECDLTMELIDLQSSVQTMLEGALRWGKHSIEYFRKRVVIKNEERGYYERIDTKVDSNT